MSVVPYCERECDSLGKPLLYARKRALPPVLHALQVNLNDTFFATLEYRMKDQKPRWVPVTREQELRRLHGIMQTNAAQHLMSDVQETIEQWERNHEEPEKKVHTDDDYINTFTYNQRHRRAAAFTPKETATSDRLGSSPLNRVRDMLIPHRIVNKMKAAANLKKERHETRLKRYSPPQSKLLEKLTGSEQNLVRHSRRLSSMLSQRGGGGVPKVSSQIGQLSSTGRKPSLTAR